MTRCPQCRHELSPVQPPPPICPRCGADLSPDDAAYPWVSVARLTDLAEVGYFADLIEADGVSTHIIQHNEFSALDGSSQTVFLLQVPSQDSSATVEKIKRELQQTDSVEDQPETPPRAGFLEPRPPVDFSVPPPADFPETPTGGVSVWRPVVLVLMAGGLVYLAGRAGLDRPKRPVPSGQPLWKVLSESNAPLVEQAPSGQPTRRLRHDAASGTIILEVDLDGDGHFDWERHFREGELVQQVGQ